jgi:hypothetical protein
MAELTALRARLKDRQVKEGALGTVEVSVCLDQGLVVELREAEARQRIVAGSTTTVGDPESLAGVQSIPADTSEVDAEVEAKRAEVRESTVWLKFRALSSVRFQEIVNGFEDPDGSDRADFMNELCDASLVEAWSGDDQVAGPGVVDPLRWEEIYSQLTAGEWSPRVQQVLELNTRVYDAPFSRKPSSATKN